MSTLKSSDPATDCLLDFLTTDESGGNYNAVIGSPHASDDLSIRTINGIFDLQKWLVSTGKPSGAVGRYQIIESTLRDLQLTLQLTGSEPFTPALQDRLAVALLKKRGYSEWWRGEITDEVFAHNLSMEWASLPDPQNGGRSHYDGIAGNSSRMPLELVYGVLRQVRDAINAAGANPIPDHLETAMTDTTPQTVLGASALTDADLQKIAALVSGRKQGPSWIGTALSYLRARISEPSSKAGLAAAIPFGLALFGLHPADHTVAMIVDAIPVLIGLIAALQPDPGSAKAA